MKIKEFLIALCLLAVGVALGVGLASGIARLLEKPQTLGSIDTTSYFTASSSQIFVGSDLATTIATTSTARRLLQITNMSGATSTAQVLSCSYNSASVTLYSGLIVFASSTATFDLNNLYTGPLRCKFPAATSSVTVTEI
jgi:hypothetical protein